MKNKYLKLILHSFPPLFLLLVVLFLQNQHLSKISEKNKIDYLQEEQSIKVVLYLQKNMPSFGFGNLIADWNFLQFIQYFGDTQARDKTGYSLTPDFFQIMVNYDPRFVLAYLQLSAANSIFAGRPDKTVNYMNQVLHSLSPETSPIAFYVWIYKGVDEILYLGDLKAAKHSYEMASKWASIQSNEYMANQTREMAKFLATKPEVKQAQIASWATILTTSPDKKIQQFALDKIKSLGAEVIITPEGKLQIKMPGK